LVPLLLPDLSARIFRIPDGLAPMTVFSFRRVFIF
jgi:hypothetical protein